MKKTLLLLALGTTFLTNAQTLVTENFNSLVVGNVTTETTGVTAGQGSYFLFSNNGAAPTTSTNAGVTNSQIVAGGNGSSLGLQITGPDGDKGGRFLWKDGLPTIWATRTAGNNIVELEIDINPGGTTTSRNTIGAYIYNADGSKVLAGFVVRAATRELFLVAYSTPTGAPAAANYTYSLAAAPGIILPASVFSRVGVSFNKTTGQVIIKAPGIAAAGVGTTSSAIGSDPAEIDFVGNSGTGGTPVITNTVAASMVMDNLTLKASATDTLLGVAQVNPTAQFSVYPNPATNFVTITNENTLIKEVKMFDVNGRTVKSLNVNQTGNVEVNISELAKGIYMMSIISEEGVTTKKIIKE